MMRTMILITFLIMNFSVCADDLDDGITAYEPIKDELNLDINLQYIKQKAKATANADQEDDDDKVVVNTACGGTGNQTFGAGANLQGATIINLSDNRGSNAVCAQ